MINAVKQGTSRSLIGVALGNVRKRLIDLATSRFDPDTFEYDVVKDRLQRVFDVTVRGGKNARSALALDSFRALNPHASTSELNAMAECASLLEVVQSFYLIIDDIMDGSETRRGKPCWYKQPNIGLGAINDALLLDAFVDEIISINGMLNPCVKFDAYRRYFKLFSLIQDNACTVLCSHIPFIKKNFLVDFRRYLNWVLMEKIILKEKAELSEMGQDGETTSNERANTQVAENERAARPSLVGGFDGPMASSEGILVVLAKGITETTLELYANHPQVDRLRNSYQNSRRTTLLGQLLDSASVRQFESFTWDRYEELVRMKTAHYSFFHPIEMAMLISDRLDNHRILRKVAYHIGFLFQSRDDILDVFGHQEVTGKVGTDIQDGKCTWVSVRALQKLQGKAELNLFKEHYGKADTDSVTKTKNLLNDLKISYEYKKFEQKYADKVRCDIEQLPSLVSPMKPVLLAVLADMINRNK